MDREFSLRLVVFEYVLPRRYAAHVCACARQVAQEARLLPPHEWLALLADALLAPFGFPTTCAPLPRKRPLARASRLVDALVVEPPKRRYL
jgi:hypothetical protein